MNWRLAATAAGWVRSRTGLYGEILSCLSENSASGMAKKRLENFFNIRKKKKRSEEERRNISQVKDASIDERLIPSSDMGRSQKLYEKRKKEDRKR